MSTYCKCMNMDSSSSYYQDVTEDAEQVTLPRSMRSEEECKHSSPTTDDSGEPCGYIVASRETWNAACDFATIVNKQLRGDYTRLVLAEYSGNPAELG